MVTFSAQPLGLALQRIALSDGSSSTSALQRALLALSALYRHGHGLRAEEMKLSALQALSRSVSQATDVKIAVQHVAASMVLSVFEVGSILRVPKPAFE